MGETENRRRTVAPRYLLSELFKTLRYSCGFARAKISTCLLETRQMYRLLRSFRKILCARLAGSKREVEWTALENALLGAIAVRGFMKIVQVEANDGEWGDPIWRFVRRHPMQTRILLCEAQPEIAEILKANYSWHPNAIVRRGAVSAAGKSTGLWRVKPQH